MLLPVQILSRELRQNRFICRIKPADDLQYIFLGQCGTACSRAVLISPDMQEDRASGTGKRVYRIVLDYSEIFIHVSNGKQVLGRAPPSVDRAFLKGIIKLGVHIIYPKVVLIKLGIG